MIPVLKYILKKELEISTYKPKLWDVFYIMVLLLVARNVYMLLKKTNVGTEIDREYNIIDSQFDERVIAFNIRSH
jgi:hypothetical protein